MSKDKRYVIPGDIITTGPYRPEKNVILDGNRMIATCIGLADITDGAVKVIPLTGRYIPKGDDLVVGKVISHSAMSWEVDINSCYLGILPASDVFGRDFSSHANSLTEKLGNGDLIAARIVNFDRTRDPLITISGRELGKIESGEVVRISTSKVPRLIGKRGSMIQMIEEATNANITIGQNGVIVISCENPNGLSKAIHAVNMIEEDSHRINLTDMVKEMLESSD